MKRVEVISSFSVLTSTSQEFFGNFFPFLLLLLKMNSYMIMNVNYYICYLFYLFTNLKFYF